MGKVVNIGDRAYSRLGRMAEVVKVTPKRAVWKIVSGYEVEANRDRISFGEKSCTWDDFIVPQDDDQSAQMAEKYDHRIKAAEVLRLLKTFNPEKARKTLLEMLIKVLQNPD